MFIAGSADVLKPRVEKPIKLMANFMEELPLYTHAAEVIDLIRNLPMAVNTFEEAFVRIYQKLYETGQFQI